MINWRELLPVLQSKGCRTLVAGNCLAFCVIAESKVEILRVLSARRNYRFPLH
jgi:plasmid stabilization system protein ParE